MSVSPGSRAFHLRLGQVLSALALFAAATAAVAQPDPPSRVGRVSEVSGNVFLAPDDTDANWQPIGINYPVTLGDNVWVGQDGRAEIDFGAGQIRLSDEANVHFSQLDDQQFSAYLASGRAILRLRELDPGEIAKLDTANAQIDILRPGSYRVETTADGLHTSLVIRDGEAQLRVANRTEMVLTGQTAVIDGNINGASLVVQDGYSTDGFDAWSTDRDRRWETGGQSSRYVSSYVPGVNDLDSHGSWETTSTYGAVWYPRAVAVDWVPYRDGQWTFVRPWGWTWVDSAPWGWAPFHYGRWVHTGHRWGWCPGSFVVRPIYAPALVAWYGGAAGTSWSTDFGGPTFGWVPLAWGEPYWPHYRYGADYWRLINRPYAVNVNRVPARPLPTFSYANARIPGAVTAVSGEVFAGRRLIGNSHVPVPVTAIAGTAITTTPLSVRPLFKPLAMNALPRGIPAPAGSLAARSGSTRPDLRGPVSVDRRPFTGRPTGVPGTISEPAPGTGRPGLSVPAPISRPTIVESAQGSGRPTVGRPSINEPATGLPRPATREPVVVPSNPGQSGGQTFTPPLRPSPSTRPATGEPMPTRPAPREPTPYNPGFSPAQVPTPPPPRPAAPVVREPAPMAPQYNPGFSPAPSYIPPPRPAAPVMRETAPMVPPAPTAAPAPGHARQAPAAVVPGARPSELQIQPTPAPAPAPR